MDFEEFILTAILTFIGGKWVFHSARRVFAIDEIACRSGPRTTYVALFVGCLVVLWIALITVAAHDVRADLGLQALFVVGGVTAIAATTEITGILGIDAIGDGIERNNPAARMATAGVWIATTICSIGANIGDGDFVGTTFAPLAMALFLLLLLCAAYSATTRGFAIVAVERDQVAGIRFAGLVIAVSLPLAKAASGNWVSLAATVHDFVATLPALGSVLILALLVEVWAQRASAETRSSSKRSGIAVALVYVAVATGFILLKR